MNHTAYNVVILEDHPIVAEGIRAHLADMPVAHCYIASSLEEAAALPFNHTVIDLWIVDLELGNGVSAWSLIESLLRHQSHTRILVYTMHASPWVLARLRKHGIRYAVCKSDPIDELHRAISALAENREYFSTTFRSAASRHDSLTERELQVLAMLVHGADTPEIARDLGISANTVCTYRKNLMRKFDVHRVAELADKSRGLF